MIYLATRGRLAAFDLGTDQKVWENTYDGTCCERPEVTPDGKTLVVGSDLKDFWYVIDAQSGALKGKIQAPKSMFAHNMALSADGKTVFMAPNGVTMTVGDVPSMKAIRTITFSDHVRPFVINHDATRVYANLNNLLGFEIADVKTGEVIKRIEAPAEMWKAKWGDVKQHFFGHGCPSHGIALTPDESEIWVVDNINYGVLVYDNTGEWPVLKMTFPTTASADWITMGLDGQYAFLSSGDVVDVKTKKIVAQMKDEYGKPMHSEKFLEMAFSNGKLHADGEPVRTRHPERRAGEARRPGAGGEQEVITGGGAQRWCCDLRVARRTSSRVSGSDGEAADPDPDLQAVQVVCGRCHTIAVFLNKPRSWDRWNDVFADMTKRGANGTDEQLARVTSTSWRTSPS